MTKRGFNLNSSFPDGKGKREETERATARTFFTQEEATTLSAPSPHEISSPRVETKPVASAATATATARINSNGKTRRAEEEEAARGEVSTPGEYGIASWRRPREDGKLRSNDRMILDYLRERVVDEKTMTTDEVGMKEIALACSVSHRTAQNTVRRLELQKVIERIPQPMGSNSGCRYRIRPGAPKSKFNA